MNQRLRNILLALLYLSALGVFVALVVSTITLAQESNRPLPIPPTAAPLPTIQPTATTAPLSPEELDGVLQAMAQDVAEQAPAGSVHPKSGRYIAAWLPTSFDEEAARASFEANADILDEVSPFWYSVNGDGSLDADAGARDMTLVELAHANKVLVLPTIHNVVLGADYVPAILSNPSRRARHVQFIVDEVLAYGYDGIDIDYESLSADLRQPYSDFVVELAAALRPHNKLVSITVHAKDCDYCGLGGFQDWALIGQHADRVRVMTYDYHWRGSTAGPVAPIYWVESVAEYGASVVDPAKLVIGVPFYGYNWLLGSSQNAVPQTWNYISELIREFNLEVNTMEIDSQGRPVLENWIEYRTSEGRRRAWFATSRSLEAKIELVQRRDLMGIAIWRLGNEDPANWRVIRRQLVEDPFELQRSINQLLPNH